MPKRGDYCSIKNLFFWRKSRGVEYWVTLDELNARRLREKQRIARFLAKNPDYCAPAHTPEQTKIRSKIYRDNNKEKRAHSYSRWRLKNLERLKVYSRNRYHTVPEHRARVLANSSLRRNCMKSIPKDDRFCVEFLYSFSKALSAGGVPHVVDHVLPIKPQSRLYCGLSNSNNLRVIPELVNARKKNKCPLADTAT